MLGTIVNAIAIIIGGTAGVFLKKGIPEKYKDAIMQGIGLSVLIIGLSGALKTENILLLVFSTVVGIIIGEATKIEDKLENLGKWLENRFGDKEGGIVKGFVTASLVYSIGAMAVMGALESGLTGNHGILFTKSLLDGVTAIIFASTLGIGVVFSSAVIFVYQGLITVTAAFIKPFLAECVIREMSAVGGLLIMAISFNLMEIKKIRVGNMLPAIFIPVFYYIIQPYILKLF
ncbi:MAG: DUF554 domain-containing protein [Natronincolaceae bacterium]|jgi:uncharacterized membrane protein YqgA involved in biofilm formation|nr:DUF554 domain-containing protein [Bacillota bacterium]NLK90656.1 DUF554 domain-containing protein [Clostridiales bacterium]